MSLRIKRIQPDTAPDDEHDDEGEWEVMSDSDCQHIAVREFMAKGGQTINETPTIPLLEDRRLRAALILEETLEAISGLGFSVSVKREYDNGLRIAEIWLHDDVKIDFLPILEPNLKDIADACADLKVVTVGTEICCGINGKPIFTEVMRSNMTKDFDVKNGIGKIQKGKNYEPPQIERILKEQGMK